MAKQIKFVDGIYGFVYDGQIGYARTIFNEPLTTSEIAKIKQALHQDDTLYVIGDEKQILEDYDINDGLNCDGLEFDVKLDFDFNEDETIIEWAESELPS
jgi:hypothetical protein